MPKITKYLTAKVLYDAADAAVEERLSFLSRIQFWVVLVEPILKCYLRENGGVLTKIWQSRNRLSRIVLVEYQVEPFFILNSQNLSQILQLNQVMQVRINWV
jgi:hypothetical protein